jgi:hypothetical protein
VIVVGPLLRRVTGDRATIWVETDTPATVEVVAGPAGGTARTFSAFGHHYALVVVDGLPLGAATPYEVLVDGVRAWPDGSPFPPSVIRTRTAGEPVRLVFGSCREAPRRVSGLHHLLPDALDAYAVRLREGGDWPDCLMLLGDQVYADRESPPITTFDEYAGLYQQSWTDPEIRWLLSTVPSTMMFDDHEIIDDWNTSGSWRAEMSRQPWWRDRMTGGLASYWIYQHLGNLDPHELPVDPVYAKLGPDATDLLTEFAARAEAEYRWSYAVDIVRTRVVVLDTRACRVLDPADRSMLRPGEWQWFTDQLDGDYDHLVLGSSLPWLLAPAIHHLEAWDERLCASPRRWVAGTGERLRRALDLEHWAAFGSSFDRLCAIVGDVGARADPPASISVLSGDVHHSYVARADLGPGVASPVHQLTCSPIHNQVPVVMRQPLRIAWGRPGAGLTRALARLAGAARSPVSWHKTAGPYFGNAVGTLIHSGRSARVVVEGTDTDGVLRPVAAVPLTRG